MTNRTLVCWCIVLGAAILPGLSLAAGKTRNVIFITVDGLRWQEVFSGADPALLNASGGLKNEATVRRIRDKYWRETPEARRETLMPFFWSVIARQGQVFGNQLKGSVAHVVNNQKFSYPGYNEMLVGWPDPGIVSNAKVPNRNVTVLEWLHRKPAFQGRVAAFAMWDVMPFIINRDRAGFVVGGCEPIPKPANARQELLNDLMLDTTPAVALGENFDSILFQIVWEHFTAHKPRVMMVGFGETDSWAHGGRYDLVLHTANKFDEYVRRLWEKMQAMPEYAGVTTFVLTADHGRGVAPDEWKQHGTAIAGSDGIWVAVLGPDTPPLGERKEVTPVTQSQVAATIAALLGEDYVAANPRAAEPIREVLAK